MNSQAYYMHIQVYRLTHVEALDSIHFDTNLTVLKVIQTRTESTL